MQARSIIQAAECRLPVNLKQAVCIFPEKLVTAGHFPYGLYCLMDWHTPVDWSGHFLFVGLRRPSALGLDQTALADRIPMPWHGLSSFYRDSLHLCHYVLLCVHCLYIIVEITVAHFLIILMRGFSLVIWRTAIPRAKCLGMLVLAWVAQCTVSWGCIRTRLSSDELAHCGDENSYSPSFSVLEMTQCISQ